MFSADSAPPMAVLWRFAVLLGALVSVAFGQNVTATNSSLPIVDLGYAIHQASISIVSLSVPNSFNQKTNSYSQTKVILITTLATSDMLPVQSEA
jgi:hypothetical protein